MAKSEVKVPKSLAGWKIPNSLRKSGVITQFLNNDLGRRILADVLVAAAGAAAAALVQHRPSEAQVALAGEAALDSGRRAVTATAGAVQAAAGTLGSVLTEAVLSIFSSDDVPKRGRGSKKAKDKPTKACADKAKAKKAGGARKRGTRGE